jgi:NitT/TauT family transport system substrate-binding protein
MKYVYVLILICCMILFLTGCPVNPDQQDGNLKSIRIGLLNGPSKISMARMMQEVPQLEEGIDIKYDVKNSPDLIIAEMVKGTFDFVIIPTTSAALLYNRGIRYQLLGIPVWGTLSLAGSRNDISDFQDLKGETVHMMGRGMTPDLVFRYLLDRHGLIPGEDVFLNYSFPAPNELANAIGAGIAEIGIISEPHTSIVTGMNPGIRRIIDLTRSWDQATENKIPFAQTAFLVREDFGEKYPGIVTVVQRHYQESINFMVSEPEEAASILLEYEEFRNFELAMQCIQHLPLNYRKGSDMKEKIELYLEVFLRLDKQVIGNKLPDENFYYPQ